MNHVNNFQKRSLTSPPPARALLFLPSIFYCTGEVFRCQHDTCTSRAHSERPESFEVLSLRKQGRVCAVCWGKMPSRVPPLVSLACQDWTASSRPRTWFPHCEHVTLVLKTRKLAWILGGVIVYGVLHVLCITEDRRQLYSCRTG